MLLLSPMLPSTLSAELRILVSGWPLAGPAPAAAAAAGLVLAVAIFLNACVCVRECVCVSVTPRHDAILNGTTARESEVHQPNSGVDNLNYSID
jgi:hypothetical protein